MDHSCWACWPARCSARESGCCSPRVRVLKRAAGCRSRRARFGDTASQAYGQASERFTDIAGRGRETYDKARQSVKRGVDEARRYANDAADTAKTYANDAANTARSYANDAADTASRAGQQAVNDINSRVDRM